MDGHGTSNSSNSQPEQQPQWEQQQQHHHHQLHILSLLPPNDRALSGRFACRDAADALSGPQHCTASLPQPLPPHAVTWAKEAGQQHLRQLPFLHKFQLLSTAAHSGSEVKLGVAWALLEPSVFPELLQKAPGISNLYPDPGLAAVRAGHVTLLGWLLRCCPGLVQPEQVLAAAAFRCDLAVLQQAWDTLRFHFNRSSCNSSGNGGRPDSRCRRADLTQAVLNAAAQSHTPDAVLKMEWLLVAGAGSCVLRDSTAAAAAASGDLGRLGWLRDRGCPFGELALCGALERAGLPVAQWLLGEGLCEPPPPAREGEGEDSSSEDSSSCCLSWDTFLYTAARGPDGVAKLRWLQQQGAPLLTGAGAHLVQGLNRQAVEAGRVEVVQYLLSAVGLAAITQDQSDQDTFGGAAAQSGRIEMAEYLVKEAGLVPTSYAYYCAAEVGSLAMVRWLALEAGVSAAGCDVGSIVNNWPSDAQAQSRALLEAVRLMVGAGCCGWDDITALSEASRRGDLALVQYLHRQQPKGQLPVGQYQVEAVTGGCEALLEWMSQQQGWHDNLYTPYVYAANTRDRGTLAVLRRLGVPWGEMDWRYEEPVLRWFVEQGAPVGNRSALQWAWLLHCVKCRLAWRRAKQLLGWV